MAGAQELERWFGEWPSFHDAEVIEIRLSIEELSLIRLRTWKMSREINSDGHSLGPSRPSSRSGFEVSSGSNFSILATRML